MRVSGRAAAAPAVGLVGGLVVGGVVVGAWYTTENALPPAVSAEGRA